VQFFLSQVVYHLNSVWIIHSLQSSWMIKARYHCLFAKWLILQLLKWHLIVIKKKYSMCVANVFCALLTKMRNETDLCILNIMLCINTTFRLYRERIIYYHNYGMTLCVYVCVYIYNELVPVSMAWHDLNFQVEKTASRHGR
jgi:hypothetical protein